MPAQWLRFFVVLALTILAACGKPDDKSLCGSVSCEAGVCSPSTGECVNPPSCSDETTCVEGYVCAQSQCVAEFACASDGTCERGECDGGACVNPDRCDSSVDCVPGYACDGDQCILDRCDLVDCARGVCDQSSGECVNGRVCTAATQATDCIDGFTCYDQACADEATICGDLACTRGECSYLDLACINAEECAGDDLNCLGGFFCNAVNQCQQNVCDDNGVSCPRGVCEAATGACVNDDTCVAALDCIDGFFCIDGSCTESMAACEVCVGNQVCRYDEPTVSIACDENPRGCVTSLDCVGSRECTSRVCGAPVPCVADAFEPNDSAGAATDWFDVNGAAVKGSICPGDVDYFTFDVSRDPQFTGTLIALLTIPAADIGVGTLSVELLNAAGASVASTTSAATDAFVRLEYAIGNINQGVYTLVIGDASVGDGGIEYDLFMDLADNATVQMCQNAAVLGPLQNGDTSNSTSNSLGSSCAVDFAATEEVWKLDVTLASYVTVTLQSTEFDGIISLRQQCESDRSEIACSNNTIGTGSESVGARLAVGSYYVVVQGTGSSQSGAYSLGVLREPIVCAASDNTCVDMNTASTCNSRGTGFNMVTCDAGCDAAIGACLRETGDVCSNAIDATGGFAGQVPLGLLRNDYNPGPMCVPPGFSTVTDGPEAVFSVTLQPNEVVYATATPIDFDDIGIYLVSDCGDVTASCIAGVNDSNFDGDEEFAYTNTTAAAQDLFLILDSEAGTLGAVDMNIVVGPSLCTAGMQRCNGTALETCNTAGIGYDAKSCAFGCDTATVTCTRPPNDLCGAGAIDVSAGGTFTGTVQDYNNDYDATSSCTGFSSRGPDAVYSLVGTVGDVVTVTLAATYDTTLYAVTNCADIAGTCLDGDDGGNPEEIEFVIRDTNPIYIVADAFSSSPTGMYTLTVTIRTPDCATYNQAIACQPDGVTLQFCDELGFFADYACATTCTAGACDAPRGDRCFDAIPLASGMTLMGDYDDFDDFSNPGIGTCILSSGNQIGPDATYAVNLIAGDLMTATLTTTTLSGGMYVLDNCDDPRNSCLWAAPRAKTLTFYAPTSGTYYLVVDSTSSFTSNDYTIGIDVQPGFACQPGAASCDAQSGALTRCSADGLTVNSSLTCAHGCGSPQSCAGPPAANDTCATGEVITGSIRISDTWDRFTNVLDPGLLSGNSCNISQFNSDGPEAIYIVSLGAGDVVDVSVDDLGAFGSPTVYITTDCTDPESTCVSAVTAGPVARAGYVSALGETVYVVVDNSDVSVDDPFLLDIDIRPSQCAANLMACQDSMTREYCDNFGVHQTEACAFGCVAGACNGPPNDTCATPTDATAGLSGTFPLLGYANDYGQTTIPCLGSSSNGPDAVYSVTVAANDIITARVAAPGADTTLWITTACGDGTACVIGRDTPGSGNQEEVVYAAPTAGTYFIMVDTRFSNTTSSFTLDINVSAPICTPGVSACAGQNVEVCDGIGSALDVFQCDAAGCAAGPKICTTATGEFPAAAFDGNALGQFTGMYSSFVDDFNLTDEGSCTTWESPGPDAAYFVDLTIGQTLTATLNGTDDTSLYIMDALSDPDRNCVVGADGFGSGEVVMYTATADMRVYVIVDAFFSTAAGAFTLDLAVQ